MSKYKLGTSAGKYKYGAKASKYKLEARTKGQDQGRELSKGPEAVKYKHAYLYSNDQNSSLFASRQPEKFLYLFIFIFDKYYLEQNTLWTLLFYISSVL